MDIDGFQPVDRSAELGKGITQALELGSIESVQITEYVGVAVADWLRYAATVVGNGGTHKVSFLFPCLCSVYGLLVLGLLRLLYNDSAWKLWTTMTAVTRCKTLQRDTDDHCHNPPRLHHPLLTILYPPTDQTLPSSTIFLHPVRHLPKSLPSKIHPVVHHHYLSGQRVSDRRIRRQS